MLKITGEAKVQMPIIYYDGVDYRVRTKLKFNVEQSYVDENLLLNDLELEDGYEYKSGENELLIDAKLEIFVESTGCKISSAPISNMIIK